MGKNYLLIVEGEKAEPAIFDRLLTKYGFNVIRRDRLTEFEGIVLENIELQNGTDNVLIAQGPKNRIKELLDLYRRDFIDFDKLFGRNIIDYNGIFLIYDVDHTSCEDLHDIYQYHKDETTDGLILVSSPCLEIMSEPERREELNLERLREYKRERNVLINKETGLNTTEYIVKNFETLAVQFLDMNRYEFDELNVMEHPGLVIEKINKENLRSEDRVIYRYFTTVLYVALAYICGKTRQIDNYAEVREFLLSNVK